MDEFRSGETTASQVGWMGFRQRLAAYLATMVDADEQDHLIVELPGETDGGTAPYVQFAAYGDGQMLRAEVSGNHYLAGAYQLSAAAVEELRSSGWGGGDEEEPNFFVQEPVVMAGHLAALATTALSDRFGIPDPGLLSVRAWGPAAAGVATLGLPATEDVPQEYGGSEQPAPELATYPESSEELFELVKAQVTEWLGDEPEVDDDGDIVLAHLDQAVWVRVRKDQPAVEVMARVVHEVRSRRATAVEIGLLNRDHDWVKWTLRDRGVWQTAMVSAAPFTPNHLKEAILRFMGAMAHTRDDLALRTGGRVG